MKGIQFLFFFFCPLFVISQTQELHLLLNFHNGNGPFNYFVHWPIKWNDNSIAVKNTYPDIKGIPSNLKNIKRGIIWFDAKQYVYQNYIEGKISKENFLKINSDKSSNFNEKSLIKSRIKCYVNVISGTNENNENVCMIDQNNNLDFSDDVPFIPLDDSNSDKELNKHLVTVQCQRVLNGKVINDNVPLLIVKNGNSFQYSIAEYATADLIIERKKYQLAVSPLYFYGRTWKQAQIVLLTDSLKTKKASQNLIVNNKAFIVIDKNVFKFNRVDIDKNLLVLQKMSNENEFSSQVGFRAPLFKSENLLNGKEISLASLKGKYVLIDFWGTWCHPCRQQLPDLIKLNNSADSSKFILISIATMDSLDNLKKVIAKENMTWPQVHSDKITQQYSVSAFPTSVLIDMNGIVIAKNLSIDDLKQKLSELSLLQ